MNLARTRQALRAPSRLPANEYKFLRRPHLAFLLHHPSHLATKIIPHLDFNRTHVPLSSPTYHFILNFRIYPKCLPRPLRRSPQLVARPQPAKPPLRRRRPARRPQRLPATRRSATRRERRLTLPTSTKVRFAQFVLIPKSRLGLCVHRLRMVSPHSTMISPTFTSDQSADASLFQSSSRSIPILVSPTVPCLSSTLSSTTSSSASLLKLPSLLLTTRSPLSPLGRSRPRKLYYGLAHYVEANSY